MYMVLFLLPVKCTWLFGGTLTVQSKSPIIEHLFQLLKASTFTNMKPDWLVEGHPQAAHLHEISHWSCITLGQFLRVVHGSEFRLFNLSCWFAIPKKKLLLPICFFCSIFPSWCFVLGLASQQKHSKFKTWIHVIAKKIIHIMVLFDLATFYLYFHYGVWTLKGIKMISPWTPSASRAHPVELSWWSRHRHAWPTPRSHWMSQSAKGWLQRIDHHHNTTW